MTLTRCMVAIALAIGLAGQPAWGHTFPPQRTVVVQVERCELAVLIGYRPGTGESTTQILGRSSKLTQLRDLMTSYAVAPITFAMDGVPLVPTSVRAKLGIEDGGARPIVVVLVTYALPRSGALTVMSKEPRTTRISWQDRRSTRVDLAQAPAEDKWHAGVASFLLNLSAPQGDSACVTTASSRPSPSLAAH